MTFILNALESHLPLFRKSLLFLESNAGVWAISILQSADYQYYSPINIFANDRAFWLVKRLLRKSHLILPYFIGPKLLIFRKSTK